MRIMCWACAVVASFAWTAVLVCAVVDYAQAG